MTFLAALEARTKIPIAAEHPTLFWMIEHATCVLNTHLLGLDGKHLTDDCKATKPDLSSVNSGERSHGLCPSV